MARLKRTAKTCQIPSCQNTARSGQTHCAEHLHANALQREIERVGALVPIHYRTLAAQYGPELEDLLVALTSLSFAADPLRGQATNTEGISAGLPDAWAGRSQLDEVGDHGVTHKGGADSWYARRTLVPRYQKRLGELARDIEHALQPVEKQEPRPPKPRCWNRSCSLYGRNQDMDSVFCKVCGKGLGDSGNVAITTKTTG